MAIERRLAIGLMITAVAVAVAAAQEPATNKASDQGKAPAARQDTALPKKPSHRQSPGWRGTGWLSPRRRGRKPRPRRARQDPVAAKKAFEKGNALAARQDSAGAIAAYSDVISLDRTLTRRR